MIEVWLIFAILSVLVNSLCDLIDKNVLTNRMRSPLSYNILTMFVDLIPMALFIILMPISFSVESILGILFGFLVVLSLLFYNIGIMKEEASRAVALSFTYPIFVMVIAFFVLKERLLPFQYLGIIIMVAGAILISIKKLSLKKMKYSHMIWILLLSAFFAALSEILAKYNLATMDYWQLFFWSLVGSFIGGLLLLLFVPHERARFKNDVSNLSMKTWSLILATCFFFYVSEIFGFIALIDGAVSIVSAITATQPLVVLLLASSISLFNPRWLREEITKDAIELKIIAILLIIAGGYLIGV